MMYIRMNPEPKAEWVAALRGGRYAQGQNCLHSRMGFCCLGVAEDISPCTTWTWRDQPDAMYAIPDVGIPQSSMLTDATCVWLGLESNDPTVPWVNGRGENVRAHLSELNDEGVPFDVIADLIEEYL